MPSLADRFGHWAANLRKLATSRPTWTAENEFAYYHRVETDLIAQQRARQEAYSREAYLLGMRILQSMRVLDTQLLEGARVLDVGAGEAVTSGALASSGAAEVWALDAVPRQLWAAAEYQAGRGNLRFVIGSATDLPFEDACFDLVVYNLVLHHIEPAEAVLSEAFRVLKPGGRLAAAEPNPVVATLTHRRTSANEAAIPPKQVVGALRQVGFVEAQSFYWWTRMGSGRLGALSPSYCVTARKPGSPAPDSGVRLRRALRPSPLGGLEVDAAVPFIALVERQEREIHDAITRD